MKGDLLIVVYSRRGHLSAQKSRERDSEIKIYYVKQVKAGIYEKEREEIPLLNCEKLVVRC